MNKKIICILASICGVFALGADNATNLLLPKGAVVVETQTVGPNRRLVLWMLKPTKHPREDPGEPYSCPERTRGSYYEGPTRVSLIDTTAHRLINTVKITQEYDEGQDYFDVPYLIRADGYYHVEGVAGEKEGRPTIMWLKDYNGDGLAAEFALFDARACMGLPTTLIGYSKRQDKVLEYEARLRYTNSEGKRSILIKRWVDYLFSKKPASPGAWQYEINYRGRGGPLAKYEIRYDTQTERFEGELVETGGD